MQQIVNSRQSSAATADSLVPGPAAIAPEGWEPATLALVFVLGGVLTYVGFYEVLSVLGPVALVAILGTANWRMVQKHAQAIWTPLFAYRLGAIAFLGMGGLVPYLGSEEVAEHLMSLYPFSEDEAAKYTMISIATCLLVVLTCKALSPFYKEQEKESAYHTGKTWTSLTTGLLFFGVGFSVTAVFLLAVTLGGFTVTVPGSLLLPFDAASAVGVFLIALHALERGGWWYFLIALILAVNIFFGLILYNKTLVLFPVMLVCVAVLLRKVTVVRVVGVTAIMIYVLNVLQPAVAQARYQHYQQYMELGGGTFSERIENGFSYWTVGSDTSMGRGEGLSRLSHVSVGSYLIADYDAGGGGDTIAGSATALIPRFLWPDKPNISAVGSELSYRMTGNDASFISPSTPGDVYWNYGWVGIALIMPLIGAGLWFGTAVCFRIVLRQDWLMMPVVLIAYRTGISVDSSIITSILPPAVMGLIFYFLLRAAKQMLTDPTTAQEVGVARRVFRSR